MKTFKDLVFKHVAKSVLATDLKQARIDFENGYGISVLLSGSPAIYSNGIDTYEVAVMKNGNLCYTTHITDDVLEYQTSSEVEEIMKQIQELPKE